MQEVLVTGGAGYIGSLLTGVLLQRGYRVTVVDDLLFGGESLLAYFSHPAFRFIKGDVCDPSVLDRIKLGYAGAGDRTYAVAHLAAIVGFPACQAAGKQVAWRYNVESVQRVFELAEAIGAERFIFSSTYSNYGLTTDGRAVTEDSPLNPQSLYAETKIAAEQYLLNEAETSRCAPLVFRFATLFGVSPRTRFDLIVNQFVLQAMTQRELIIYQAGYSRSFVHIRDVVEGIVRALSVPREKIRGQIFNLGSDSGNYTKDEIVALVKKHVDGLKITYKDLSFGGDMRDITVSFAKIRRELGFEPAISVEDGIVEVRDALHLGLIKDATDSRYRNAQFIVQ
ncbi:MAG: epimerase [Acidobacteria bacterium RIFCSPLOWO2_12_FULL_65_11]|nr:MAG: epimerase [Acidobacteria bacterium RIFCSPLOWO2_02_FULL_64_15]OFW32753.1 MAG: epimerase [Acidobacteria bacterium RIFCSPLOWO2_12_FULL_65_11]